MKDQPQRLIYYSTRGKTKQPRRATIFGVWENYFYKGAHPQKSRKPLSCLSFLNGRQVFFPHKLPQSFGHHHRTVRTLVVFQ